MKLYWQYLDMAAWWIMKPINGMCGERLYGPFYSEQEKRLAADVHRVPV